MNILIVGGGVAGLSLAALLASQPVDYTVVERVDHFDDAGYMLGLYPLGSRILHGIGAWERFLDVSKPIETYAVNKADGAVMQRYDLTEMNQRLGPMRQLSRPDLLGVLGEAVDDDHLRMATSPQTIDQTDEGVEVVFDDGRTRRFDLVVGADGIDSTVRQLCFDEPDTFDTGWGAWVWWAHRSAFSAPEVSEFWGAGRFLGVYPTRERLGMVAVYPRKVAERDDTPRMAERIRDDFLPIDERTQIELDAALPTPEQPLYYWPLSDIRARRWTRGRVALMGDAAAAFLPTAGVGASMAMESAAVLADELSRTGPSLLPRALALYVERRKQRVEAIQDESRNLGRMMFVKSRWLASLRNFAMRFYSVDRLINTIATSLDEPI